MSVYTKCPNSTRFGKLRKRYLEVDARCPDCGWYMTLTEGSIWCNNGWCDFGEVKRVRACDGSDDGKHCECWYGDDGEPCCDCGQRYQRSTTNE